MLAAVGPQAAPAIHTLPALSPATLCCWRAWDRTAAPCAAEVQGGGRRRFFPRVSACPPSVWLESEGMREETTLGLGKNSQWMDLVVSLH